MRRARILLIGDYYVDQIFTGVDTWVAPGQEVFAQQLVTLPGGAFTHARALHRLDAPVVWAADLGEDEMSDLIRQAAEEENLDDSSFLNHPGPRRRITVAVTHAGDRGFVSYRDNTQRPNYADMIRELRPTHVLVVELDMGQSWHLLADACADVGAEIILDPQHNTATIADLELVEVLSSLAAFLPNADEAMAMSRTDSIEAAAQALGGYVPLVVIKDGGAGALLYREGVSVRIEAPVVAEVVDTVGAGDCFDAGFVAGVVAGLDPAAAVELGVVCGSLSVQGSGGSAAPTTAQIAETHPHLVPGSMTT